MRRARWKAKAGDLRPGPVRRLAAALVALGLPLAAGGCSLPLLTFQAEPEASAAKLTPEPLVTGSISQRPVSFGPDLGDEDWRRAHAALTVALDPQGNGRPVKWDNPETEMRGSINPTGLPYVANDEICRDFLASVIAPDGSRFVRGTGCKPSGGAWALKRMRPTRAGSEQKPDPKA